MICSSKNCVDKRKNLEINFKFLVKSKNIFNSSTGTKPNLSKEVNQGW